MPHYALDLCWDIDDPSTIFANQIVENRPNPGEVLAVASRAGATLRVEVMQIRYWADRPYNLLVSCTAVGSDIIVDTTTGMTIWRTGKDNEGPDLESTDD